MTTPTRPPHPARAVATLDDVGDERVVPVGNGRIPSTDNSFPHSFTVAPIRTMISKLK